MAEKNGWRFIIIAQWESALKGPPEQQPKGVGCCFGLGWLARELGLELELGSGFVGPQLFQQPFAASSSTFDT